MLILLMAPAATIVLSIFSSIMFLWEKVALFRNGDASIVTVSTDQHLNHVGDAAVVSVGGLTDRFLDARVDTQI
jgi:hypothetical protein